MDSTGLNANETGRKNTRATETIGAERDDVSVWELVGLVLVVTSRDRFELCVVVKRHVAKFLFDITTDLPLCGGHERVPPVSEELHQRVLNISASQI